MTDLIFSTGLEWGVPPGGDQGGQGGLSFYVVTKGGQWSYMSPLKLGNQIQHGDDSVGDQEDALLNQEFTVLEIFQQDLVAKALVLVNFTEVEIF